MRVSIQTEAIEENRYQDEKHQSARLPYLLGARSAPVAVGDVPCVRPAGFTEPTPRHDVLTSGIHRATSRLLKPTGS